MGDLFCISKTNLKAVLQFESNDKKGKKKRNRIEG